MKCERYILSILLIVTTQVDHKKKNGQISSKNDYKG